MNKEIKIGDTVKIIDSGQTYSTYSSWPGIPEGYRMDGALPKGRYIVVNIAPHTAPMDNSIILALTNESLERDKRVILINTRGVKKVKPSIESRIQEALLSPGFIDKVAEAVLSREKEDACEATEPEIEYPYVGIAQDQLSRVVFFNSTKTGMIISNDNLYRFGHESDKWAEKYCFKPFNGTITYKAGKPVKTEETK